MGELQKYVPEAEALDGEVVATFGPKCIWCGADWSDDNIKVYNFDCADHCESGRFSPEAVSVSIVCHACNREMYRKEAAENCYSGPYAWKSLPGLRRY